MIRAQELDKVRSWRFELFGQKRLSPWAAVCVLGLGGPVTLTPGTLLS